MSDNNFFKDDIFYIHGDFDETISRNIVPELDKFISDNKNKVDKLLEYDHLYYNEQDCIKYGLADKIIGE